MSTTPTAAESASSWSFTRRDLVVLLLSVAGGGVDGVIILGFHVLTAAQTGNTILLAVAFAERRLTTGFHAAVSVVAYVIGSAVGELILLGRKPRSRLYPVGWALLAELMPLGSLLVCWHLNRLNPNPGLIAVLVALAATAMGIQSAAVLRLHAGPTTTYVTGTLTTFATEIIRWLRIKAAPRSAARQENPRSREGPAIYGVDWLVYAGGALASAFLFLWVGETALVLPIVAVIAAVAAGVRRYS